MNHKRTMIALAVIMMAVIPMSMITSDESDASMNFGDVRGEGFTNTGDGTLFIPLISTEAVPHDITITVTETEGGRVLATATVTVPAETTYVAELRFRLGAGEHNLTVTCTPADPFPTPPGGNPINYIPVQVTVTESIWSKPTTFAAIAVIAILIVIAAYMRMRSAPTTKPEMTFTELEKRQKGSKADEEKPKASATERRRYRESDGSAKGAEKSSAPPPEKKAETFTELDRQKKAETASKKESSEEPKKAETASKKESSSEEPKKLKYVSSRRK
ncbi:MAG: hypothetical protein FWG96_06900 [Methanomassiliicoccaceae archaeon]|nr:hypothetical protein [Methanomassiliicoccaceae archaeon]